LTLSKRVPPTIVIKPKLMQQRIRGIDTRMRSTDAYVDRIIQKALTDTNYMERVRDNLNQHAGSEKLNPMDPNVIPLEMYLEVEREGREISLNIIKEESSVEYIQPNDSVICEWENIHHKVIFDAFNTALDYERPYALQGKPQPFLGITPVLFS
jgi:hypothetical protein